MAAMQIQLNGESREIPARTTLAELLDREGLGGRRVAVEINLEIVPRSQHAGRALSEGDRVEVVQAIGGG
jgi:sulfur carrier protein